LAWKRQDGGAGKNKAEVIKAKTKTAKRGHCTNTETMDKWQTAAARSTGEKKRRNLNRGNKVASVDTGHRGKR